MKLEKRKFLKKLELVRSEDKYIKWHIGYSLGTLYEKNIDNNTIELWNLGYCPASRDFYYDKNIHFPKEIVNYFNGAEYSKQNIILMEEYGIYNLQSLVELYEDEFNPIDECYNERIRRK